MARNRQRATAATPRQQETRGASPRFTATQAKNEFGRVLEMALHGGGVIITRHDAPKAILISVDEFDKLQQAAGRSLDTLRGEFDALLAGMQTPKSRGAMKSAFSASPRELASAAVNAARKRG
jgi:prevent-host-death family protein